MPMPHEERKRRFKAAAALAGKSLEETARDLLGVSHWHLTQVLDGRREGSEELKDGFAQLIEFAYEDVWGERPASKAHVA